MTHFDVGQTTINVIVPAYNCMEWLPQCLESIRRQDVEFRAMIFDDASTDPTQKNYIRDWAVENEHEWLASAENTGATHSIWFAIAYAHPLPDDIIVIVDGDDWFPHDSCLRRIAEEYEDPDCWLTYGSYVPANEPFLGSLASAYPQSVIRDRTFRSYPSVFNHPISFKGFLWDALDERDLRRSDGKFYQYLYDHAIMYPLLEMAGEHHRFIPDSIYVYNNDNSLSAEGRDAHADADGADLLARARKPAMRLEGGRLVPEGD